jgi:hypothetical protein
VHLLVENQPQHLEIIHEQRLFAAQRQRSRRKVADRAGELIEDRAIRL